MGMVIGIIVVLAIAALFAVLTCKSKNSDLFKWIGIAIFIAFCLTWVIPYGYFQNGTFYEYSMKRLGLTDIPSIAYYGVYFCLTTIIYLFAVGGLYGVLSKTKSYQALVGKTSKFVKGKELPVSIVLMVLFVGLTSIISSPLALLVLVPFVVSVLLNAKFDKITTMGLTFGSILVGTLAATYGTDGLSWFNNYMSITDISVGLNYRLIIAIAALLLFVAYNIFRVLKMTKQKKINDLEADTYPVEAVKGKDVRIWPAIVVLGFLFVIVVLGFVGWETNFKIETFKNFHKWLTELKIGEDFTIFSYILGGSALAFGKFEISTLITIVLIVSGVVALMNHMSAKEFAESYADGFGKMFKPVCLYTLTYILFMISYMSPFMAAASDWAYGLTKDFNPFIMTITGFVTSVFHADLGYTAYIVGSALQKTFASNFDLVHTLYVATYGLVQVIAPTSGVLLLGLSYLKIDYKSWFKYIWMFVVAMLAIIFVLAAIIAYAL